MAFECPDGFELLFGEGEQLPKLPDRANGVLRLPPPIVPLGFGNVAPERVAPLTTGRFFFFNPHRRADTSRREHPGTLVRFVHRLAMPPLEQRFPPPDQLVGCGATLRGIVT